jgi:beta-glucosidase
VESLTDDLDNAKEAMQGTDLTIVCGGATSTEGEDRASLRLDQEDFINAVTTAGQDSSVPVAVVALAPGTILTPFRFNAAAVLALFLGGTPTGSAFASVIFGDVNPSAKSPVTFPVYESDTVAPCFEVDCPYTEGLLVGYRQFDANDTPVCKENNRNFWFRSRLVFCVLLVMPPFLPQLWTTSSSCNTSLHHCYSTF